MRILLFYKNTVYAVGLCLVFLTFFTVKKYGGGSKNAADFVVAKHAFLRWEQSLGRQGQPLKDLMCLLKRHPELQAEYQAKMAQNLIAWQEGGQAKELGMRVLERTSQPYFKEYAQCSLLIAEKQLDTALERALLLKEKMLHDDRFLGKVQGIKGCGSALFAFNLMRIATLCQEMGMGESELEAWRELKTYSGFEVLKKSSGISYEGFQSLQSHFAVGNVSLVDYISWREEQLAL